MNEQRITEIMKERGCSRQEAIYWLSVEERGFGGDIINVDRRTGEDRAHHYRSIFSDEIAPLDV